MSTLLPSDVRTVLMDLATIREETEGFRGGPYVEQQTAIMAVTNLLIAKRLEELTDALTNHWEAEADMPNPLMRRMP